jgi:hypothetical protein
VVRRPSRAFPQLPHILIVGTVASRVGMPFPNVPEDGSSRLERQCRVESYLRTSVTPAVSSRTRMFVRNLEEAMHNHSSLISVAEENAARLIWEGTLGQRSGFRQGGARDTDGPVTRWPSASHATVPALS